MAILHHGKKILFCLLHAPLRPPDVGGSSRFESASFYPITWVRLPHRIYFLPYNNVILHTKLPKAARAGLVGSSSGQGCAGHADAHFAWLSIRNRARDRYVPDLCTEHGARSTLYMQYIWLKPWKRVVPIVRPGTARCCDSQPFACPCSWVLLCCSMIARGALPPVKELPGET
jgi:hypothetical protein